MSPLRKLLSLSPTERWLLICTWLLPFRTVQAIASSKIVLDVRSAQTLHCPMERVGWAIRVASAYLPFATCLSQALTAQILLRRRGYPAVVRIGVARTHGRRLEAHAWVECAGQIVIGGSAESLAQYTPLPSFPLERHHVGR